MPEYFVAAIVAKEQNQKLFQEIIQIEEYDYKPH